MVTWMTPAARKLPRGSQAAHLVPWTQPGSRPRTGNRSPGAPRLEETTSGDGARRRPWCRVGEPLPDEEVVGIALRSPAQGGGVLRNGDVIRIRRRLTRKTLSEISLASAVIFSLKWSQFTLWMQQIMGRSYHNLKSYQLKDGQIHGKARDLTLIILHLDSKFKKVNQCQRKYDQKLSNLIV